MNTATAKIAEAAPTCWTDEAKREMLRVFAAKLTTAPGATFGDMASNAATATADEVAAALTDYDATTVSVLRATVLAMCATFTAEAFATYLAA